MCIKNYVPPSLQLNVAFTDVVCHAVRATQVNMGFYLVKVVTLSCTFP